MWEVAFTWSNHRFIFFIFFIFFYGGDTDAQRNTDFPLNCTRKALSQSWNSFNFDVGPLFWTHRLTGWWKASLTFAVYKLLENQIFRCNFCFVALHPTLWSDSGGKRNPTNWGGNQNVLHYAPVTRWLVITATVMSTPADKFCLRRCINVYLTYPEDWQ